MVRVLVEAIYTAIVLVEAIYTAIVLDEDF